MADVGSIAVTCVRCSATVHLPLAAELDKVNEGEAVTWVRISDYSPAAGWVPDPTRCPSCAASDAAYAAEVRTPDTAGQ